jgi:hypothetical protein
MKEMPYNYVYNSSWGWTLEWSKNVEENIKLKYLYKKCAFTLVLITCCSESMCGVYSHNTEYSKKRKRERWTRFYVVSVVTIKSLLLGTRWRAVGKTDTIVLKALTNVYLQITRDEHTRSTSSETISNYLLPHATLLWLQNKIISLFRSWSCTVYQFMTEFAVLILQTSANSINDYRDWTTTCCSPIVTCRITTSRSTTGCKYDGPIRFYYYNIIQGVS